MMTDMRCMYLPAPVLGGSCCWPRKLHGYGYVLLAGQNHREASPAILTYLSRPLSRASLQNIMEYDKVVVGGAPESKNYPHESIAGGQNAGRLRVKGPEVDVSPLKQSITLPFSGRTAKNRFLKAYADVLFNLAFC